MWLKCSLCSKNCFFFRAPCYFLRAADNSNSRKLEPFSISLEGSSYRESTASHKKHSPISAITSCLLISLLSRTIFNSLLWLDFLSNWSCCSHNLIASKKTDLNQQNSPFTSPFRSLLSARCRQLWPCFWLCTRRVLRMCHPHKVPTSTTGQPSGSKIRKRDFHKF